MLKWLGYIAAAYLAYRILKKGYDMTDDQTDYLARTIWGEARGEGARGMQAVGNVILNRVARGGWYGASIKDVVLKPYQFSAWNVGDPNRTKMLNATDADLRQARTIALQLQAGTLPDITGGATNYHATSVSPAWAKKMTKTVQIGNHVFYKE